MHSAALSGNIDELNYLIEKGYDVDVRDNVGDTPLMLAVGRGHTEAILLLSAHGADLHARNSLGLSAFEYAINYEQPGAAALLHELTTIGDADDEMDTVAGEVAEADVETELETEVYADAVTEGFVETADGSEQQQLMLALQQALQPLTKPPPQEVQEPAQAVGEAPVEGGSLWELQRELRTLQMRLQEEEQARRAEAARSSKIMEWTLVVNGVQTGLLAALLASFWLARGR